MPKVKGKHFPYTSAGKKAAQKYAEKTGGKVVSGGGGSYRKAPRVSKKPTAVGKARKY